MELNIYDPYDDHESVANKRSYRNVDLLWDNNASLNCAQFNMQSVRRGTSSIGVIAALAQSTMDHGWKDRPASLGIEFSDPRHQGHNLAQGFQSESQAVIAEARAEQIKMPAINIGLSGPSVNIVEWGRFLREKVMGSKR